DRNRSAFRAGNTESWRDNLLESVEAERKSDCWKILAECAGQSVIPAAACNFEAEAAHIRTEENAGVVVESSNFAEIDGEMLGKIEFLKNRMDLFQMIERLNRSRILHESARIRDD